ncbi:MAG: replicative DNA helicase [Epsilonproteobacteria bacterium]|nr:MAG: replicative DNA helicase [Campylobacterota bacterium]RLA66887.1 MAG: replicative DNA helicase [Campylobacterota bacterium]
MSEARELPHDLLAEKSLLGCLIIDSSAVDDLSDLKIDQKDFYHPQYGIIYESILDLNLSHQPVDYITLTSRLTEKGKLEAVGGQKALLNIVEDQASSANVYTYGKIVKDKASLRKMIRTAGRIVDKGMNFSGKIEDFIQDIEESFFKLTLDAKKEGMQRLNTVLKENLKELENTSRNPGEIMGIPTGYPKLDQKLLGMQPGQLIILAARPAMGKTSLALNMAINAVEQSGLPIAIFSLEMMAQELSFRLLSGRAKLDSKKLKTKNFNDTDLRAISRAVRDLSEFPILINDDGVNVLDIQSQCRKIKAEQGLGMVIIDYLQLMKSHTKNPSREQQIAEISRSLKEMAKELECPVFCLSQLNRGVENRPGNKRPNVSDLRESGAIEQDADVVMMIYRDEVYNPDTKEPGVAEIIVGKNRSGEIGTVKLAWIGPYTSFENMAYAENTEY